MIQRIQSIYMLVAAICMGLLNIMPIATADNIEESHTSVYLGLYNAYTVINEILLSYPIVGILAGCSVLIAFIAIFLFKKRNIQLLLNKLNLLIISGFIVVLFVSINKLGQQYTITYNYISLSLPIISMIASYLAIGGIKKDEAIVRSADRLR